MRFINVYLILSVSLFISTISKLLVKDMSAVGFFTSLIKSSKDFFVILNFAFSVIVVLLVCIGKTLIGNIPESAKSETTKKAQELGLHLIFFFVFFMINDNDFFLLIPYAVDRVFGFMLKARLNSLLNIAKPPTNDVHYKLLIGEFFLFFFNLALTIKCIKTDITSIFSLFFSMAILENVECLFNHFIYIGDNEMMGNGKSTYFLRIRLEIVFKSLNVLLLVSEMFSPKIVHAVLFATIFIVQDAKTLFEKHKKLSMLKYYTRYLNETLPSVTKEELPKDEVCLICREELTPANVKKLSCGHFFHVECLEKWIIDHSTCPFCKAEIIVNDAQQQQQQQQQQINGNQQIHQHHGLFDLIQEAILRHRVGPIINGELNPQAPEQQQQAQAPEPVQEQEQEQQQPAAVEQNNADAPIFDEKGNEVFIDENGKPYSIDENGKITYFEVVENDEEDVIETQPTNENEEIIDFNAISEENEPVLKKAHKESNEEKLIKKEITTKVQEPQIEDPDLDDDTEEILETIHALKNTLDALERRILKNRKKH